MENNLEDTSLAEQPMETIGEAAETPPAQSEPEPYNPPPEQPPEETREEVKEEAGEDMREDTGEQTGEAARGEAGEPVGVAQESAWLQPGEASSSSVQASSEPEDLHGFLEMLKQRPDVIGYVLRDKAATNIELKDPTKLIEYAILSSASIDAGEELSQIFYIGNVKRVVVSGKNVQVISLTMGENKVSVFIEKDADPCEVLEKLENFKSRRFMGL